MSESVEVPYGDKDSDNAVLLLAAAQELDLPPSVITTTGQGFVVPKEVHDKAFGNEKKTEAKAPAKKTAKKAPAQKSQEKP